MTEVIALPIPVDAATAAWAGPVFVLMALTGLTVLIWQAVRYFRDDKADRADRDDSADQ